MRLRFGRPSLPLLIFFAALFGVIFYLVDNRDNLSPNVIQQTASTEVAVIAPTAIAVQATVFPSLTETLNPRRVITRQEIPGDASIYISRAGVVSNVIQAYLDGSSWDISQLRSNVGHLEGTAWVDQPGNVVLSGHVELSDGKPGIFAELNVIQINDLVRVQSNGKWHTYMVTEVYMTTPHNLEPLMPTPEDRLTLITCNSYDFFTNAYLERVIVVAERMG
jgi:LPXTG-site transpeptidase (sortase) family protein